MNKKLAIIAVAALCVFCALSQINYTGSSASAIVRKPLLMAAIEGQKTVDRVDVREIDFGPRQKTGLHLHPIPVVGYIAEGTITFQIEGQPEKTLKAGDAFFEPANTRMLHFDNATDGPAKFICYYLLGKDDHDLIKMLTY